MLEVAWILLLLLEPLSYVAADKRPDYYWRNYSPGDIPHDAVEGCPGRFIGQIHHTEGNLVATIYPQSEIAASEWDGRYVVTRNIRIFCTPTPELYRWEKINVAKPFDGQMDNAVKGGYQVNVNQNYFIGKVTHQGECKISKVLANPVGGRGMWVWKQGGGHDRLDEFYVLKYNISAPEFCTAN